MILAPRYVTRARDVAATATSFGFRTVLGSTLASSTEPWQVLVVDRLGELAALYAVADVVFVGGTMIPRGGHNLLEPAARGRSIVVGPFTEHITEFVDGLGGRRRGRSLHDPQTSTLVNAFKACSLTTSCVERRGCAPGNTVSAAWEPPINRSAPFSTVSNGSLVRRESAHATRGTRRQRHGDSTPMKQRRLEEPPRLEQGW